MQPSALVALVPCDLRAGTCWDWRRSATLASSLLATMERLHGTTWDWLGTWIQICLGYVTYGPLSGGLGGLGLPMYIHSNLERAPLFYSSSPLQAPFQVAREFLSTAPPHHNSEPDTAVQATLATYGGYRRVTETVLKPCRASGKDRALGDCCHSNSLSLGQHPLPSMQGS